MVLNVHRNRQACKVTIPPEDPTRSWQISSVVCKVPTLLSDCPSVKEPVIASKVHAISLSDQKGFSAMLQRIDSARS